MAQRVIGLDIGTNAVRAVEMEVGERPLICRMGQVALAPGAVVDGEVADVTAVALALRRLWAETGFRTRDVRVSLSSPRVIVKTLEMPPMARDELISTIRLQLEDYVPLSPDDTVFGVHPLDWATPGEVNRPLLLAATHRGAVEPLLDALAAADLKATAVDVVPAALALALCDRQALDGPDDHVDVIVSIGAATVVVVAARRGEAAFVRTLTNVCGHRVTAQLATELGLDVTEAERHKRIAAAVDPESPVVVAAIIELISELRASLDFYALQPDALPVRQMFLTGGGSLLNGLTASLRNEMGLTVVVADPFANVRLGNTGFEPSELPDVAPYLAAAVGVALGASRPKDRRLDLTPPREIKRPGNRRRALVLAAAVLVVSGAGAIYMANRSAIATARSDRADVQLQLTAAQADLVAAQSANPSTASGPLPDASAIAASVATRNVDWPLVESAMERSGAALGISISSFQGTADPAPLSVGVIPPTPSVPATVARLTLIATAPDIDAVAAWLDAIGADERFVGPWVAGLTVVDRADGAVVQFTMDVALNDLTLVQRISASGVEK